MPLQRSTHRPTRRPRADAEPVRPSTALCPSEPFSLQLEVSGFELEDVLRDVLSPTLRRHSLPAVTTPRLEAPALESISEPSEDQPNAPSQPEDEAKKPKNRFSWIQGGERVILVRPPPAIPPRHPLRLFPQTTPRLPFNHNPFYPTQRPLQFTDSRFRPHFHLGPLNSNPCTSLERRESIIHRHRRNAMIMNGDVYLPAFNPNSPVYPNFAVANPGPSGSSSSRRPPPRPATANSARLRPSKGKDKGKAKASAETHNPARVTRNFPGMKNVQKAIEQMHEKGCEKGQNWEALGVAAMVGMDDKKREELKKMQRRGGDRR